MIALSVRTNFPEVQSALDALLADLRTKALAAAINKTVDKAKTEMVRRIIAEFAIRAADVRSKLNVRRASAKGAVIEAVLEAFASRPGGRALNVIRFMERAVTLAEARRRAKGGTLRDLRFRIKRGGPLKSIPGAFVATANRGTFVARRVGRARYPIEAVQTIDIPSMFQTRRINAAVVARIEREFPVEFARASAVFLARFNASR